MRFQALSQFMPPDYQEKSVEDFIRQDGYRKIMQVAMQTCKSNDLGIGATLATIPNGQIWDRLAQVARVGIGDRSEPSPRCECPDDFRGLKLLLDVWAVDGNVPQSLEDWEEIISLQERSHQKAEEQRIFANKNVTTYWPVGLI